jgi:AcrR family transcriptional regulator
MPVARETEGQTTARAGGHPREARILAAAVDVFWERGFAGGSVQQIAARAEIPKASIYHVFSSKDEVLFEIFDRSHANALEIMDEASSLDGGPLEKLRNYLVNFVVYYIENPKIVGLYYRERRVLTGEWEEQLRRQRREYDSFVGDLLEVARSRGEIPGRVDPRLATFFVIGAINGIADWHPPVRDVSPDEFAHTWVDIALGAIDPPGP